MTKRSTSGRLPKLNLLRAIASCAGWIGLTLGLVGLASAEDSIAVIPNLPFVITLPSKPVTVMSPRYNEVAFKATHNSYWVKRDNVHEIGASGTEERILDQLLFEGVRSLELDIHRHTLAHMFGVYHTDKVSNSLCTPLDECLKQLLLFQFALPEHDPVTIVLELKEVVGSPFDADHTIQDLDATIENYLGPYLYRPRDIMDRCSNADTIRDCLKHENWPTLEAMRGKFVFALIGNWNGGISGCVLVVSHNRRAWVEYGSAGPGATARSSFLMESPWINSETACQEQIDKEIVESAIKNSAFMQFEGGADGLFSSDQQTARAENRIVRADVGQDNRPTLSDQIATVQSGLSLIQNDHPWNTANDRAPLRPGIPIYPEKLATADAINEPGHRILFTSRIRGPQTRVFTHTNAADGDWTTLVAVTRPPTNDQYANPANPRGVGCLRAQAGSRDAGDNKADHLAVCRLTTSGSVLGGPGENARIIVESAVRGRWRSERFDAGANAANGIGELLRLSIQGNCVTAQAASEAPNSNPAWTTLVTQCFDEPLTHQGLTVETGDVLFIGTRHTDASGMTRFTRAHDLSVPVLLGTFGQILQPGVRGTDAYRMDDLSWP